MDLVKRLQNWQADLEELATERSKAEGRLEQALESLKDLGYSSVEEAKKALDMLETKKLQVEEEAESLLNSFKEKYAEFIQE
jgi:Holliday junction resolvasome RuvABC DNA-binding subunit